MNGTLRSLGLNQTTPAGTTSYVIFSEDGKQPIASVEGTPPRPGFLAVWDVNQDNTLSPHFTKVAPGKGELLPFSMTVIPGKNQYFVSLIPPINTKYMVLPTGD
jgi:hypothetical protein